MKEYDTLDYDDVRVVIRETTADPHMDYVHEPDLSFEFGELKASLPVIFYYETRDESDTRVELAAAEVGALTAGAMCSKIPYLADRTSATQSDVAHYINETIESISPENVELLKFTKETGKRALVSCATGYHAGAAMLNDLKLASGFLIGLTQSVTIKGIDTLGMSVPRITMLQQFFAKSDVPLVATAASASDVCKALVAGADAVLVNIGGPFEAQDDVMFLVRAVASSLKENIERLCRLSGCQNYKDLAFKNRLLPVR